MDHDETVIHLAKLFKELEKRPPLERAAALRKINRILGKRATASSQPAPGRFI